jgi:hypothetical protein
MRRSVKIVATGGGAHKFYDMFGRELGVEVHREDEMECLDYRPLVHHPYPERGLLVFGRAGARNLSRQPHAPQPQSPHCAWIVMGWACPPLV